MDITATAVLAFFLGILWIFFSEFIKSLVNKLAAPLKATVSRMFHIATKIDRDFDFTKSKDKILATQAIAKQRSQTQLVFQAFYAKRSTKLVEISLGGRNIPLPLIDIGMHKFNKLLPLSEVVCDWTPSGQEPASLLEGFDGIRRALGDTITPDMTYRLINASVNDADGRPTLEFSRGRYDRYINTCEALYWNSCAHITEWLENQVIGADGAARPLRQQDAATAANALARHDRLRKSISVPHYNKMSASMGVSCLTVRVTSRGLMEFILHDRSIRRKEKAHDETDLRAAEAQETVHVVPAGTFQPEISDDRDHATEFSIEHTVVREFAEELLGCRVRREDRQLATFSALIAREGYAPLAATKRFFDQGFAKLYFLGVALDVCTLKPECMLLCIFREEDYKLHFPDHPLFSSTYEGEPSPYVFNRDAVERYLTDRTGARLLAAAMGCLGLSLGAWDEIQAAASKFKN